MTPRHSIPVHEDDHHPKTRTDSSREERGQPEECHEHIAWATVNPESFPDHQAHPQKN